MVPLRIKGEPSRETAVSALPCLPKAIVRSQLKSPRQELSNEMGGVLDYCHWSGVGVNSWTREVVLVSLSTLALAIAAEERL